MVNNKAIEIEPIDAVHRRAKRLADELAYAVVDGSRTRFDRAASEVERREKCATPGTEAARVYELLRHLSSTLWLHFSGPPQG